MNCTIVTLPASQIHDWDTFHKIFQDTFGFPDFYGRNMDAWIDCMTDLDDPSDGMSRVKVQPGEMVVIQIPDADALKRRCSELYDAILEGAAFVNYRRVESGDAPVLSLLLIGSQ